jgi:hypothetical protein
VSGAGEVCVAGFADRTACTFGRQRASFYHLARIRQECGSLNRGGAFLDRYGHALYRASAWVFVTTLIYLDVRCSTFIRQAARLTDGSHKIVPEHPWLTINGPDGSLEDTICVHDDIRSARGQNKRTQMRLEEVNENACARLQHSGVLVAHGATRRTN